MNTQQNTNMNPVESTSLFPLSWREECCDEGDNSIYEAASPYYDDGSPFYFRIRQRLRDNKHEFYEASDSEVMMDEEDPRTWESLDAAKAAMQADADNMVREHSGRTTAQTMKTEASLLDASDAKDAERFRWLIKQGVAWRDCYGRDWMPGEWLYSEQDARHFVDEAMAKASNGRSDDERNQR